MAWYAYCIAEQEAFHPNSRVRRPFPIEGLRGVGGAQVIGYPSGEFVVIASEYLKSGTLEQKAALEHAHVISECFKHGTVLPFKFATVFENEDSVRQAVRANRKVFMRSVAQLRGKSEMHLKVRVPMGRQAQTIFRDQEFPVAVGAEYLTKIRVQASYERERQTRARALSAQVHKLFNPLDEEITCRHDGAGTLMIGIAHLIDSGTVEKYQSRFNTASKQFHGCELVISGPWPPFHFLPEKLRSVDGDS
jgi:Gas vesicle synthesis protein GvpL/GvpF